jgi:hypothetical protein
MGTHLPYCERPDDEFQMPDGRWCYSLRAIVLDSWLLWKHALPAEDSLRRQLDIPAVAGITALASQLHAAHCRFPEYPQLDDSPFTISCWWDPSDTSGQWSRGERLLTRLEGHTATSLCQALAGARRLEAIPRSAHWVEIALRTTAPAAD